MSPLGAAFVSGASISLVVDEGLTPALGFSAPSRDYPLSTHMRGFLAHLGYSFVAAAVAETLYALSDRAIQASPDRDYFAHSRLPEPQQKRGVSRWQMATTS